MNYYVVKYSGPFGFIKPWTAVRDGGNPGEINTMTQQFLTPSILEGMEKKLFPELLKPEYWGRILKIKRYRLNYQGINGQLERTWSKGGFSSNKEKGIYKTNLGVLNRGVMLNPNLYLAFQNRKDAEIAFTQTLCLCRNEDLIFPESLEEIEDDKFDEINGFELIFTEAESGFKVGHNRFENASEMFGELKVFGNPIRT
ncbi:hypothetical protein LV84_03739 [Algoriphagus ratkowskyi]|uniref:Uncharacterized protein n=2 Tax=Algoriphagus ratkowskyi TaxID=57028 RepID=A0A2W7SLL4_9BACT|nr:hypothetical protein LV84_03739 [Algoriphagus ratkowskyi]TXD78856.1 hypothetical protein ESW18_04875 [Algoriphagus ratkowskyi]